jgi:hypothetical protein
VRGRSFDQPEASTRHHRERLGVVGSSHQVGSTQTQDVTPTILRGW